MTDSESEDMSGSKKNNIANKSTLKSKPDLEQQKLDQDKNAKHIDAKKHNFSENEHKKNYSRPFLSSVNNDLKSTPDKIVAKQKESNLKQSDGFNVNSKKPNDHDLNSKTNVTAPRNSPQNLKRKHSSETDSSQERTSSKKHKQSPVPQELRKAVTEIMQATVVNSGEKKKPPCQYGVKCYRKNPSHFAEFSHPRGKLKMFL